MELSNKQASQNGHFLPHPAPWLPFEFGELELGKVLRGS